MKFTVSLHAPSEADDIRCQDGEIVLPEGLSFCDEPSLTSVVRPVLNEKFKLPDGAKVLCFHKLPGEGERWNVVVSRGNYASYVGNESPRLMTDFVRIDSFGVIKVVAVGNFIVFLCADGLRYALWSETERNYLWLDKIPAPPVVKFVPESAVLYPYVSVAGDYPEFDIRMSVPAGSEAGILTWLGGKGVGTCPDTVKISLFKEISKVLKIFVGAVKQAGLYFGPVKARAAWKVKDYLWLPSAVSFVSNSDGPLSAKIVAVVCEDGMLSLRLRLSMRPYKIGDDSASVIVSGPWRELVSGAAVITEAVEETINPDVVSDAVSLSDGDRGFYIGESETADAEITAGVDIALHYPENETPQDIISEGETLFILQNGAGSGIRMHVSVVGLPMLLRGSDVIPGGRVINICESLRALSSGQLGDFPLYAFTDAGIRALTPAPVGFRDVQLISRDVPFSAESFASLPDSTCFITRRGVMLVKGSSVKSLSEGLSAPGKLHWEFCAEDRIAYHYGLDALLLFRSGTPDCRIYGFAAGRWVRGAFALDGDIGRLPVLMVSRGNAYSEIMFFETTEEVEDGASEFPVPSSLRIITRPLKFGSALTVKKLTDIAAMFPDGIMREISVFGSLNLRKWHNLGKTTTGLMRLRGSGWRFFMFEIAYSGRDIIKNGALRSDVMPLIMCNIETK